TSSWSSRHAEAQPEALVDYGRAGLDGLQRLHAHGHGVMHRRLGPAAERLPELREALEPPRLQARRGQRWLLARERALEHRGRQGRVSQQRLEHFAQQVVLVLDRKSTRLNSSHEW